MAVGFCQFVPHSNDCFQDALPRVDVGNIAPESDAGILSANSDPSTGHAAIITKVEIFVDQKMAKKPGTVPARALGRHRYVSH